ncbi:MAG TPA: YkgJ family cysteine cluster protein [Deltaproteobacteria bacterium]|nr:YkgJ family cysteine cluster protein [Deltaproteobacteria bacterium]
MESFIDELKDRRYFFDKGICFECTNCGSCCTGEPGIIYVNEQEISAIAEFSEVSREIFVQRCLYSFQDSFSIQETADGRCIFYENGCAIYPVRPMQCRTFPFWFQNMRSVRAFEDVALKCPGIGKGPLYSKDTILECIGQSYHLYQVVINEIMGRTT